MSAEGKEEINFWPGYVDALINVLLNLLFLVGIFTVGLVMLNVQVVEAQRKLSELQVQSLLKGTQGAERQRKAQELLNVISRQKLEHAMSAETEIKQQVGRDALGSDKKPPLPEFKTDGVVPMVDIRIQAKSQAAVEVSKSFPNRGESSELAAREALVLKLTKGVRLLGQWVFDIHQYQLPEGTSLHVTQEQLEGHYVLLVVVTDPENQRLSREAFARLMSVRNLWIQSGVEPSRLRVRIVPESQTEEAVQQAHMDRIVFAVALPR